MKLVFLSSKALAKYSNYTPLDVNSLSLKMVKSKVNLCCMFNDVIVYNLNPYYIKDFMNTIYPRDVVVLTEKIGPGVEVLEKSKNLKPKENYFFINKDVFHWYFFYKKKGLFTSNSEKLLSKVPKICIEPF